MKIQNHKLIYKVIVGSTAYGTNTPESDIDIKGIYIQDPLEVLIGNYIPQIEVSKDEVYFEVGRFLELLSEKANPTMFEMIFADDDLVLYKHPIMNLILQRKYEFISKQCKDSFGGMAVAQIKKAKGVDKMMNWKQQRVSRKTVLDFCYINIPSVSGEISVKKFCEIYNIKQNQIALAGLKHMHNCYELYIDYEGTFARGIIKEGERESNEIRLCSIPKGIESVGTLYYNKDGYSMHCKEYKKYQDWLKNRNESRLVDTVNHGQKIDGKNLLHCRRLIEMGIEIAQGLGVIVRRSNSDELLKIRRGEVILDDIISSSENDLNIMSELFKHSELPDKCDPMLAKNILKNIRKRQQNIFFKFLNF